MISLTLRRGLTTAKNTFIIQGARTFGAPLNSVSLSFKQPTTNKFEGFNNITFRNYNSQRPPSADLSNSKNFDNQQQSLSEILEREIQDESAELNQQLATDQFPGFSVETDDADVKLTKQVGATTVTVRFTVSSSLNEWPGEQEESASGDQPVSTALVCMPDFQIQINKDQRTLEISCYFEEMDTDEETGEPYSSDPMFNIDELVLYQGEPKETEFAVNVEYFQDDLQAALQQYLADYGINEEFAKNLVQFATRYEKKQYVGLMKRLKSFVSS